MDNKENKRWVITVFEEGGPEKIDSCVFSSPTEDEANDFAREWTNNKWSGHMWTLHGLTS